MLDGPPDGTKNGLATNPYTRWSSLRSESTTYVERFGS